jgi:hypothetical protein
MAMESAHIQGDYSFVLIGFQSTWKVLQDLPPDAYLVPFVLVFAMVFAYALYKSMGRED